MLFVLFDAILQGDVPRPKEERYLGSSRYMTFM